VGFLTNNGSRSPDEVVEHLRALGFAAQPDEVITSGQAAVRMLAERVPTGSPVVVVGTESLAGEATAAGFRAVRTAEPGASVLQGHSPDTGWRQLAEACLAIRSGGVWVACNVDATLPDERGLLPGNGAMVAALREATGQSPVVAGKPEAALFDEALRRSGARRALVVGDRLDTDIAGANGVRLPSLLVLTGVSTPADVLSAPSSARPDFIGADLGVLWAERELTSVVGQPPWRVEVEGDQLSLRVERSPDNNTAEPDPVGALRALCAAHWAGAGGPARVRGVDEPARRALHALDLPVG
jgi:HAD superfamily hydrolase (TIGR01450 family)